MAGFWGTATLLTGAVTWLPAVLIAPLLVLLLLSPLRTTGRALLAALLPLAGVTLLTFGLAGLMEGHLGIYVAGGLLGTTALLAGGAVTCGPTSASSAHPIRG
jgi:hypothetical protein